MCQSCGRENADGARFCNACGAVLTPSPAREVRKTVTVLFADVTGSTSSASSSTPSRSAGDGALLRAAMSAALERHGGDGREVHRRRGHGRLRRPDCARGRRAARSSCRRRASRRARVPQRRARARLRRRRSCAPASTPARSSPAPRSALATGDAVNVAARLEQAAQPGEILIGEQTLQARRASAVDVEPVEPLSLKGKAEPLGAYRLVRGRQGRIRIRTAARRSSRRPASRSSRSCA